MKDGFRFVDSDNPNDSVNEAVVDDLALSSTDNVNALTASSATPPIGSPLVYSLAVPGMPNAAYVLAVSLTTGPTYIGPIGTFDLGFPLFPLTVGALDGSGNGSFSIPIPPEPALVNVTVHAQAYVQGSPSLITNRTTITFRAP
jgi:hypothetical protein